MRRPDFLAEVRSRLQKAFDGRLRGVILYGSEARGDAGPDSDIDLLVLLDGPIRLGRDLKVIVAALYPVQLDVIRPIHAIPVDAGRFAAGKVPLYLNATREGVPA